MEFVRCSQCQWLHVGITTEEAEKEVKQFNDFYINLPKETRDNYGSMSSIDKYKKCFKCGGSYKNMKPSIMKDKEKGSTIQAILFDK